MTLTENEKEKVCELYENGWFHDQDSRGILDQVPITESEFIYSVENLHTEKNMPYVVNTIGFLFSDLESYVNN